MRRTIDLNCDLGESFGAYTLGDDAAILPLVTSANIACGFHAGDPLTMRVTVRLAKAHGVSIGAHPGFRDLVGFGRRELRCTPDELYGDVLYQLGALAAICHAEGTRLHHVKPHGALYNMAARDAAMAEAIAAATAAFDPDLVLYALAGSALEAAGRAAGLRVAAEAFADRRYCADGTLAPRGEPGAVIADPAEAARQACSIAFAGTVTATNGETVLIRADTICIHGDNPAAAEVLRAIRLAVAERNGIVAPPFAS